ncbi:hypothetical protein [Ruegeria arenilitoris]|uniref:hypothetical protein n=1 Tax=Ruegeria arenilitoris TaxID=1173585 RepID=UPI001480AD59|nr:hypothetical protein [Ruegeria arenilitoris]
MIDPFGEILARHDAASACGCTGCDDDYCAYVEHPNCMIQAENRWGTNQTLGVARQRKSIRYLFESQMSVQTPDDL